MRIFRLAPSPFRHHLRDNPSVMITICGDGKGKMLHLWVDRWGEIVIYHQDHEDTENTKREHATALFRLISGDVRLGLR
jgi:hypothetical protein